MKNMLAILGGASLVGGGMYGAYYLYNKNPKAMKNMAKKMSTKSS